MALARSATGTLEDFYLGLEALLSAWLMTPDFLFIQERSLPPLEGEQWGRLTAESMASRLSYFFWNQGPDRALLDARRGKLAAMRADESALFQSQLEALTESPAERKARMEARATELKDKRVIDKRDLRWGKYAPVGPGAPPHPFVEADGELLRLPQPLPRSQPQKFLRS